MKRLDSLGNAITALCLGSAALVPASATGQPATTQSAPAAWEAEKWRVAATIYSWLPAIDGKVIFPGDSGSTNLHVPFRDILSHLKMTFMGALDVHNGRWGMFTDALYLDVGGVKSQTNDFTIGNTRISAGTTADLTVDLKSWVWTLAGEYRVASDPAWSVDLLAGARMLYLKPTLGWSLDGDLGPVFTPGRSGSESISETLWDGIVGVKGRYAFGEDRAWFVPFYLDVGTGQTKFTWQATAGVGYSYRWGDVLAVWRYLDWNAKSGSSLADLNMSGPMLGVVLHW
jgi:hypothetical protein